MYMDGCLEICVHACACMHVALRIEYLSVTLWKCFIWVFFGILFRDKIMLVKHYKSVWFGRNFK